MRGHPVDTAMVRLEGVSKRYRLRSAPNRSLAGMILDFGRPLRARVLDFGAPRGRGSIENPESDRRVPPERKARIPRYREFWALQNLSVAVEEGEVLGVIGCNGAGKSTLFKLIAGVTPPTQGWLAQRGRLGALIEVGAGIHPELTGRENIYQYGSILGLSWREVRERFDRIVQFADLGGFIDQPVKRYSSGMQMRLGFAVAVHVEPDVLLVDEVLAVGDAAFQARCLERVDSLRRGGTAILLASHDLDAVERMSDRVIWLDHGRLVMVGEAGTVIAAYRTGQA